MQIFETARDAALKLRPDDPVYCFRPEVLKADARDFMGQFPGKTAYAVKTNGEKLVLKTLAEAGVEAFDVASPAEFAAVRSVAPNAEMLYMHPVKAQSDIRLALEEYGIRVIVVDHEDEVTKLIRVVRALDIDPGSLTVFVRIQTKGHAAYELSKKFGAGPAQAVELLRRLDRHGYKLGLCFHVGSQIQDPDTYERALASADWVRGRAGVELAALDVGGGFPAEYGHDPNRKKPEMPSLDEIMARLRADIVEWGFDDMPLVAEDTPMPDALLMMSQKGFGVVGVTDEAGRLTGIVTDGDLRRHMQGLLEHKVSEVMTAEVATLEPDASMADAARVMVRGGFGSVVVVLGRMLLGILTERDVLRAAAGEPDLAAVTVETWMTADPDTAGPDFDTEEAASLMLSRGFRHLPIVDGEDLVGMVSLRDVLSARIGRR